MSDRIEEANLIVKDYTAEYAKYVATSRAIPALMDGLKPSQRRCIDACYDLKLYHNKKFMKASKIEGDVLGSYHPHGGVSLAGLIQPFKIRYPLMEGQGNWGSSDLPYSVAASRYVEARLSKFCEDFYLSSADYADREPNYDGRLQEITLYYPVLPGVLFTGASGIAVGFSTEIPAHTITDVGNSLLKYLDHKDTLDYLDCITPETCEESVIHTPKNDIRSMYLKGEGSIRYGAKTHYETVDGKPALVVDAFPPNYQKKRLETPFIIDAVEKGNLELHNESAENLRYVFISSSKEILQEIEKRLETSVGYRFYIEHRGIIKKYPLADIYGTFVEEKSQFFIRKYSSLIEKGEEELNYLNILALIKLDKDYIKSLLDMTSEEAVTDIQERYKASEKVARRVISVSLRNLMADNIPNILESIEKIKSELKEYHYYVTNPLDKIREDIVQLLEEYRQETKRAAHIDDVSEEFKVRFRSRTLKVKPTDNYFVGTRDNQVRLVSGEELRNMDLSDACLCKDNYIYYILRDERGACGVTREILLNGSKLKSDKLTDIVGTDNLTSLKVKMGNGKVYQVGDWIMRKRSSYVKLSENEEPPFQFVD